MRPSTIAKPRIEEAEGPQAVPPRAPAPPRQPAWKRKTAQWARWLHIYLSMASFAILFFFAVTGLTLNHQDWFTSQQRTMQYKGRLDPRWVGANVDQLAVVEALRTRHGITKAVNEFRVDDGQVMVSFKGPGYEAAVFIDRASGTYDVTENKMGLAAVLNDLHKGRDSGKAWGAVIDVSAVLMTLVSITGIVLILFLQKRRFSGLLSAAVGAAMCYFVYRLWVP